MAHKHHRRYAVCPNCQYPLEPQFDYCPKCAQQNHDLRLPFGHVVYEVVEGFTHFDGKLWVTLRDIFTRPGQVPLDFIEGRRQRHVPPIRLYIFVSFVLFLLINVSFNGFQERSAGREERLRAVFGPNREYRQVALQTPFELAGKPVPHSNTGAMMLTFPLTDSVGVKTLRRWRSFSDAQLDSVLRLYNRTVYDVQRYRLRTALNDLPATLPWLPLREPDNVLARAVDSTLLARSGFPKGQRLTLRYAPGDTLGQQLYSKLKRLSVRDRAQYAYINNVIKGDTSAGFARRFSRLVDVLQPQPASQPLKFPFTKGNVKFEGLQYTNEAAARADLDRMRLMTSDERLAFYAKRSGSSVDSMGLFNQVLFKRLLSQHVHNFDKSENEISTAQVSNSIKFVSYSFFVLMPLVAVFLYLVYRRSKRYFYVDHLIFSINMHTVGFILLIVLWLLISYTVVGQYFYGIALPYVAAAFAIGPIVYFLLSLRTVYQQTWPKTLLKFLLLTVLYSATFTLLVGGMAVLGIF